MERPASFVCNYFRKRCCTTDNVRGLGFCSLTWVPGLFLSIKFSVVLQIDHNICEPGFEIVCRLICLHRLNIFPDCKSSRVGWSVIGILRHVEWRGTPKSREFPWFRMMFQEIRQIRTQDVITLSFNFILLVWREVLVHNDWLQGCDSPNQLDLEKTRIWFLHIAMSLLSANPSA